MPQLRKGVVMRRQVILAGFMVVLTVSCAGGSDRQDSDQAAKSTAAPEATEAPAGVETTVDVALAEYSVEPGVSEAPAGTITFAITIEDPDENEAHNFVVLKTDLSFDALPTLPAGNADTTSEEMEIMGFLAPFGPGDDPTLKVDTTPGKYVLICNIVDHYKRGMRAPFTVA
jgi:uncharacterized cupredoxin-like copper-binding protein